ncbi:MAG: DUF3500 domain-containing protein, partial [Caulobacteraceae bacterium]
GACGATLFAENRLADVVGHTAMPYVGPEHHYISFNGEPSEKAPWMLMIGGHHIAFNFMFNTGEPGATPLFAGSDPARFTDAEGVAHFPMSRQGGALADMAQAVAKYPEAHLPGVYTDLVRSVIGFGGLALPNGERKPGAPGVAAGEGPPPGGPAPGGGPPGPPGGGGPNPFAAPGFGIDANYPLDYPTGPSGRGVAYSRLSRAEQALVRNAIEAYAALPGRRISAPLLELYERADQLADTYVGLSGDPKLVAPNAYVRIDGPRVWIEMSVQPSLVEREATHFHSVWRDKRSDYGGRFRG